MDNLLVTLHPGVNLLSSIETHVHFFYLFSVFLSLLISFLPLEMEVIPFFPFISASIHVQAPPSSLPYSIYLINSSKTFRQPSLFAHITVFAPLAGKKPPLKHLFALSPFLYQNPCRLIMNLSFARITNLSLIRAFDHTKS